MTQDELLAKNKYFLIIPAALLTAIALWHLTYVHSAAVVTGDDFLYSKYAMIAIAWIGLVAVSGIVMLCMGGAQPPVWAGCALMLGLAVMQVMPGLSGPDEPVHYISAYTISNHIMGQEVRDGQGRVYMRAEDFRLEDLDDESEEYRAGLTSGTRILGHDLDESTYRDIENWERGLIKSSDIRSTDIVGVVTTPVVYLPQALGITLARLLHLNALFTVTLGRFFNLLVYTLIIYAALVITPVGKELMMAVSFLPMTIELSASFSYDAMLIALCWLFIALVLRTAYDDEPVSSGRIAALAAVIGILAPCKMVYSILVLLLLLIPQERFGSKSRRLICWAACLGTIALGLFLVNSQVIASYASATESTLVWAGEEGWTLRRCLHEPLRAARMFYDTIMRQGSYYFITLLGGYLGNADPGLDVPFIYLLVMTACMVLLAFRREDAADVPDTIDKTFVAESISQGSTGKAEISCEAAAEATVTKSWHTVIHSIYREKIVISVTCLLLTGMLMGSMLIGWTPLSSDIILGVSGRYLLPVLPALLMLLKNNTVLLKRDISAQLLYVIVCCDAAAFIRLFAMVCLKVS